MRYANGNGLGIGANSGSGYRASNDTVTTDTLVTSDGAGTGDVAVLVVAAPENSSSARNIVGQRENANEFRQWHMRANVYVADGAITTTNAAGYFSLILLQGDGAGTYNSRSVYAANQTDGNTHCWLGIRRGTNCHLWRDGLLQATRNHSVKPNIMNQGGTTYFATGGFPNTTTVSNESPFPIHFIVAWNWSFSDAEAAELSRDPFSLVIPA
jgi:hypothetical protein